MTGADTTSSGGANLRPVPDLHPRVGPYLVPDASAAAGAAVWVALFGAATFGPMAAVGPVDLFVALAVLVLVPLGFGVLSDSRVPGSARTLFRLATLVQFPAALTVVVALVLPVRSVASVGLALPWLGVTGAVAIYGLARLVARGGGPLPELAVDAGLLYVPVGAVALVLHRAGVSFHFDPVIVQLTVVHFHYAGFALPLFAGVVARELTDERGRFGTDRTGRAGAAFLGTIVGNIALIAVGITFSPVVEVVAVALFTVAVAGFGALVLVRVVPSVPGPPAAALAVASTALLLTMALALAYGYSAFPATGRVIGIGRMIAWHGTLNAFAFALPALLACRWLTASGWPPD